MFAFFRKSPKVVMLPNADAFWSHCDKTQQVRHTPKGPQAEAEERLRSAAGLPSRHCWKLKLGSEDERAGTDAELGLNDDRVAGSSPPASVQARTRPSRFRHRLPGSLRLSSRVILVLHDDWKSEAWVT